MNGVKFALLLAQVAADAADVADLAGVGAPVVVGAGNNNVGVVGDGNNDPLGADLHALEAAGAFVRVHTGNAVDHMDGVKFTGSGAGAEAQTAAGTGRGAVAGDEHGAAAVGDALIAGLGEVVLAAALDHGDLPLHLHGFHAHDGRHFFRRFLTAGGAQADFRLAVDDGLGVGLAACKAAAAAVGAGKGLHKLGQPLIGLYGKDLGGHGQHTAEDRAHDGKDQHRI